MICCYSCGNKIHEEAKACPKCGAVHKRHKKRGLGTSIVAFISSFIVAACGVAMSRSYFEGDLHNFIISTGIYFIFLFIGIFFSTYNICKKRAGFTLNIISLVIINMQLWPLSLFFHPHYNNVFISI